MKSPSRPRIPLSDRKMILQDQSYLIQKEINQRRQTRVQQARQRANEVARVIRQRTEREKIRLVRVCSSLILYEYFRSGPPFLSVSHFNITKYPSSLY